jgi:hypothetical protein
VLPGIDGFAWDAGHIIFLGAFYAVLMVVFATVAAACVRAARDFRLNRAEEVRWQADFHDLPAGSRRCRHELSGEVRRRTCDKAFECGRCATHARLLASRDGTTAAAAEPGSVAGLTVPSDRLYHRGHTWVRTRADGVAEIGLDDLGAHLLGRPDRVQLPPVGTRLTVNGTGWRMTRRGVEVRVLSPLDGEVLAHGGGQDDFVLRVRPLAGAPETRHLLAGAEAGAWMLREADRLQLILSGDAVGGALADGGVLVPDLSQVVALEEFDAACGEIFLEP